LFDPFYFFHLFSKIIFCVMQHFPGTCVSRRNFISNLSGKLLSRSEIKLCARNSNLRPPPKPTRKLFHTKHKKRLHTFEKLIHFLGLRNFLQSLLVLLRSLLCRLIDSFDVRFKGCFDANVHRTIASLL